MKNSGALLGEVARLLITGADYSADSVDGVNRVSAYKRFDIISRILIHSNGSDRGLGLYTGRTEENGLGVSFS
jgi:hypothetical protein